MKSKLGPDGGVRQTLRLRETFVSSNAAAPLTLVAGRPRDVPCARTKLPPIASPVLSRREGGAFFRLRDFIREARERGFILVNGSFRIGAVGRDKTGPIWFNSDPVVSIK